ncbi:MAG: hypothetical protein U0168_06165 [Nannocystaceae bacterium]
MTPLAPVSRIAELLPPRTVMMMEVASPSASPRSSADLMIARSRSTTCGSPTS